MSQILSASLLMMNSIMFTSMNHPMSMGLMLLLQTFIASMLIGLLSYSSWFSYILFLVFLGGMLVLFIYMTSIASNEMFSKNNQLVIMMVMFTVILMAIILLMDPWVFTTIMNDFKLMTVNEKMNMLPLYNNPTAFITVFMVLYLFLTLIVIAYITKYNKGPLRPN